MPPPKLPGNAPVPDIFHPVEVGLGKTIGNKLNLPGAHRFDGRLSQRFHAHKPLLGNNALNGGVAAVAGSHIMGVVFDLDQIPALPEIIDQIFAAFKTILSCIPAAKFVNMAFIVKYPHNRQMTPLAHLKVIWIMSRCDLYRAGAEFHFAVTISHNGDLTAHNGDNNGFSNDILIPFIFRVHGNGRISQHGFRTGGSHRNGIGFIRRLIPDMPQMTDLTFILYFCIAQSSLAAWTPVDDPVSTVNKPFVVKSFEETVHCPVAALIHGETFPLPIAGRPHLAQLLHDGSSVFVPPVPSSLQKAVTPQIQLVLAFLSQSFHNFHFCCNGSMVCAGQPKSLVSGHPLITDDGILKGIIQCMPHMQFSCDVGRGNNDGKGFLIRVGRSMKITVLLPVLVPFFFYGKMVVTFRHVFHKTTSK